MSPKKSLLALTAAIAFLGSAGIAAAQTATTCTSNADCQHGYTCQVSGVVGTGTVEPACPPDVGCPTRATGSGGAAADDPTAGGSPVSAGGTGTATGAGNATGSDTPAADGGTAGPDDSVSTISTCQPGPCTADTDCAAGMVCHSALLTTCSGGKAPPPCPADTKCDTSVTDPICTTETVSTCAFKWALPCNADADCGDGFSCQPSLIVSCSGGTPGGTGTGTSGGGSSSSGTAGSSAGELVADSCTTTMNYPGSCRPLATTCATSADCPSNWVCQDNATVVGEPGTGGISGGGGAAPAREATPISTSGSAAPGAVGAADVAAPASSRSCVAPYTASPSASGGGAGGRTGTASGSDPTMSTGNDGTPPKDSSAGTSSTGGTTGTGGPTGPAGTGSTAGTTDDAHGKGALTDNSGGCSVIPAGGSAGAGLLAGLGLGLAMLVARRRRA